MNSCRQVSSVLRSAEVLTKNYTYMLYSATQLSTGWRHVFTFNIDNSELQPSGLFSSLKKPLKRIYSRPLPFLISFDLRTPSTLIAAREKERLGFNSRHSSTMFVYGIFKQKNGNRERERSCWRQSLVTQLISTQKFTHCKCTLIRVFINCSALLLLVLYLSTHIVTTLSERSKTLKYYKKKKIIWKHFK